MLGYLGDHVGLRLRGAYEVGSGAMGRKQEGISSVVTI
jgi:hypothetical protein